MAFDPKRHTIRVQGNREYLPVSARLVWFRNEHPDWGIVTNPMEINLTPDNNKPAYAIFQAQIFNAEGKLMATATKMEDARGFSDFIEKAETGSVGRALAMCGYGTQFAPEFEEGGRLSDSPQPIGGAQYAGGRYASRPNMPPPPGRPGGGDSRGDSGENFSEEGEFPRNQTNQGGNGNAPARTQPQPVPARPVNNRPPVDEAPAEEETFAQPLPDLKPGVIPAPSRPAPAGKVAPSGAAITRVREPEPDDLPLPDENEDEDEEDPFNDEETVSPPTSPAPRTTADAAASNTAASNQCSAEGCSNLLNNAQISVSTAKFGRLLCPQHQREATPLAPAGRAPSAGSGQRGARTGGNDTLL